MHRFFIPPQAFQGNKVVLSQDQAHQIGHVLRLSAGQRILVLDNQGWQYEVELAEIGRQVATGIIVAKRPAGGEPVVPLTLYQSLLKRDKFEWVLQKGTEVGVARFVPVVTQRSLVRGAESVKPSKRVRWQRILAEAAEQCRRGRIPDLAPPQPLEQALSQCSAELALLAWEGEAETTVSAALANRHPQTVALFIGPEGGFTAEEVDYGRHHSAIPITLGPRILRTETAAVVAAALILHQLGDLG